METRDEVVGCDGLVGRGTWETGRLSPCHTLLVAPSGEGGETASSKMHLLLPRAAAVKLSSHRENRQKKKLGLAIAMIVYACPRRWTINVQRADNGNNNNTDAWGCDGGDAKGMTNSGRRAVYFVAPFAQQPLERTLVCLQQADQRPATSEQRRRFRSPLIQPHSWRPDGLA